jgi:hypothetical protein
MVQAHTAIGEGSIMWVNILKNTTMIRYVAHNLEEIWCNAKATLEILDREHPGLYKHMLQLKCGLIE